MKRVRIRAISKHTDNPLLYNVDGSLTPRGSSYLAGLDELGVGTVLYRRLRLGEWCAAEGVVWETYDRGKHLIPRPWNEEKDEPLPLDTTLGIKWYFGSQDWGYTAPGVLTIWGVAPDGSPHPGAATSGPVIFRVAEVYRTQRMIAWWVDEMSKLHAEFDLQAIVCDPEDASSIEAYNTAVGSLDENKALRFARPADNRRQTHVGKGDMGGIDLVRLWFAQGRLFLLKDSLRTGIDQFRKNAKKPYETSMEIPSYVYLQTETGKRNKELTDPGSEDHGCDTVRYAVCFASEYDLTPTPIKPAFGPGSLGDMLGWDEVRFED